MNPESTSEWIKILFAYGPLGALVAAGVYGAYRAAIWVADHVIQPAMVEHIALVKMMRESGEKSAEAIIKIEHHADEIRRTVIKQTAAQISLTESVKSAIPDSKKTEDIKRDKV